MKTEVRFGTKSVGRVALCALLLCGVATFSVPALAGGTIAFGDGESVSLGLGLRTSFDSVENAAPDGKSRSTDFTLDSLRLYISGSLTDQIKATFNTERAVDGTINLLDGYAQFEFMDGFNIWVGRMLPPSDRSNLDGPYYLNSWSYPGIVSQYPAKFDGRDDGATVWGKLFEKKLVYAVGIFQGHDRIVGAANQADNMLYAGRIAYNFLDAEPDPGYYTSSTYYGSVDVLTLALAGQYQKDGVGTALLKGDYKSWNTDLLFEKKLPFGVVTFEGAYYQYGTGGVADVTTSFGGASPTDNVGGLAPGDAYLIGAAYLIPGIVGWGQFQPFVRYQDFNNDLTKGSTSQWDVGVNYVIKGHNARLSLDYSKDDATKTKGYDQVIVGLQLQF